MTAQINNRAPLRMSASSRRCPAIACRRSGTIGGLRNAGKRHCRAWPPDLWRAVVCPRLRLQEADATIAIQQPDMMSDPPPSAPPGEDRLDSWKEIAAYLKRDVKTVQRWEKREGMPVRRHVHEKLGSVYAFRSELD